MTESGQNVAEMEATIDGVYSRLAKAYGRSKGDIAKLAVKRYGGNINMTPRTEEVVSELRGILNNGSGRGGDVMDKMLTMEMIRDMRAQRERPPPPQYPQEGYGPQRPMQQQEMTMQQMMMMMIIPAMAKSMGGGEDELMKIYKMKLLMSEGEDGKGINLEKIEQMMREERAESEARTQQLLDTIVGRQEAEKLRAEEVRWRKEIEQKAQNAEYLARNPTQSQEPPQTAMQKLDEGMDMMSHVKGRMENVGMVQMPDSPDDKKFELDKMGIGHKQGIETEAVKSLSKSVDKLANTGDHTLNKVIDFMAKEQEVKTQQQRMGTPEGQQDLQKQYEALGNQVMRETEPQGGQQPISDGNVAFSEEDDLDATD